MTNFQATLLLNQLERFEEQVDTRERNIAYLSKGMEAIDGLQPNSAAMRVSHDGVSTIGITGLYPKNSAVFHAIDS